MPKTTKEVNAKESKNLNSKSTSSLKKISSKTVAKKTTSKAKSTSKTNTKKATATKKSSSSVSRKTTSTKKTPSKKQAKKVPKTKSNPIDVLEYYDLPYRYNETIVRILAQTPKTLFVYWDISDNDIKNYIKQYGNDFFEKTKPVLIIHNQTLDYTFEIEINDFANCWYFDINDEKCEYSVELGRRPKEINSNIQVPNNYLYITSSNKIESPNGHILFEKEQKVVFFKDVKTNQTFSKDITNIEFMKYFGKAYKMQEIYKKIYRDEQLLNIDNPSSKFN